MASTMRAEIADFIDTLNTDKARILESRYPEDELHEYADSAVPVYNRELAELLADDPGLATLDEPDLVPADADIWKRIQIAIYERLLQAGHEWLQEAKQEARDAEAEEQEDVVASMDLIFAAVGDDGRRPVVWGLGETPEMARADARRWLAEAEKSHEVSVLGVHQITDEQAAVVRAGNVNWPIHTRGLPASRPAAPRARPAAKRRTAPKPAPRSTPRKPTRKR